MAENVAEKTATEPWTAAELAEVSTELQAEIERIRRQLAEADLELSSLVSDHEGQDTIDRGFTFLERDHERAVATSATARLRDCELALRRLQHGEFGRCEECGRAIAKERLQALPHLRRCIDCERARRASAETERVA